MHMIMMTNVLNYKHMHICINLIEGGGKLSLAKSASYVITSNFLAIDQQNLVISYI